VTELISPYGNQLINLLTPQDHLLEITEKANSVQSIQISERSTYDLELLATGAFSPLDRFIGEDDYKSILETMRLTNGYLFPIPITLPVTSEQIKNLSLGNDVALRNSNNNLLALMKIEEIYKWNSAEFAKAVLLTNDESHPLVAEMNKWGNFNISGKLQIINIPERIDFQSLRLTPQQTRTALSAIGKKNVVAFQTRNPLHRIHEELTKRASAQINGTILIHPVVGLTKPGDVDHYTRVRTYRVLVENYYDKDNVILSLLPLAMRMAGPREALWHAIIRRNYGANYFIVGRDHAGPGIDSNGNPFYGPYDAQEIVTQHQKEINVKMIPFQELVYVPSIKNYEEIDKIPAGTKTLSISGTQVRTDYLEKGISLPTWFTRPKVAEIMNESYPAKHEQGFCIWFTGLSGSGKTTTAEVLTTILMEYGRQITLLDGDVVRTNLSQGLGFSKQDRDTNIRRIGYVASEIVRHGGIAICAAVSPYIKTRSEVRNMIGKNNFIEIFVNTPLSVCENRDMKGMYAKARRGMLKNFTGIDDPYEEPKNPEIEIKTTKNTVYENVSEIMSYTIKNGFIQSQ